MNLRYPYRLGLFFCLSLGLITFFALYPLAFLNPMYARWMLVGDPSQHFFGFNFFLKEPWHFPPGNIENLNFPQGTSLVYTDSIPLLAIPLKLVFINGLFQFHGPWILLCFLLQAGFAYHFLYQKNEDAIASVLGSILFLLFPSFLMRGYEPRHYSCLAHFLIVWAIMTPKGKGLSLSWITLLFLSLGIHFYFFYLNALIFLVTERSWLLQPKNYKKTGVFAAVLICFFYLYGYFVIPISNSFDGGFGNYSMNLLSWINPRGLSITQINFPARAEELFEGYQYLGLGTLLAILALFLKAENRAIARAQIFRFRNQPEAALLVFFALFSFSICLSLGPIKLPEAITAPLYLLIFAFALRPLNQSYLRSFAYSIALLSFFIFSGHLLRSSGRAGWYLSYALILWGLSYRPSRALLLLAALIQFLDVAPLMLRIRHENEVLLSGNLESQQTYDHFLKDGLDAFVAKKETISLLEISPADQIPVTDYALTHHLKIGPVYLARGNLSKPIRMWTERERQKIATRSLETSEIIATQDLSLFKSESSKDKLEFFKSGRYLFIKAKSIAQP